jgi:hypothetical protein
MATPIADALAVAPFGRVNVTVIDDVGSVRHSRMCDAIALCYASCR